MSIKHETKSIELLKEHLGENWGTPKQVVGYYDDFKDMWYVCGDLKELSLNTQIAVCRSFDDDSQQLVNRYESVNVDYPAVLSTKEGFSLYSVYNWIITLANNKKKIDIVDEWFTSYDKTIRVLNLIKNANSQKARIKILDLLFSTTRSEKRNELKGFFTRFIDGTTEANPLNNKFIMAEINRDYRR